MATKKKSAEEKEAKSEPAKQEMKTIRIPIKQGEMNPAPETVRINENRYVIPKGEDVEVPMDVYDILRNAGIV